MKYISTRGQAPTLDFEEVLLTGLATDGGLYVPEHLPHWSAEQLRAWRKLSYPDLAYEVLHPFVAGFVDEPTLRKMLAETYATFAHSAVAPLKQLNHNEYVLELFHGPTLAFKDFALQLLGRLLDLALQRRGERGVVMGATSGDTGSAAIWGCRDCAHLDVFILFPHERVSDVQRRQMTTVSEPNVHNIALQGNFDDCQRMVKASFRDQSFLRGERRLIAVNSINWARIMAQVVYYVYSALALGAPDRTVAYSVPTGNFGDIFAGYLARQMGLPISQLIVATNQNDVLHRMLQQHHYQAQPLAKTLSPSMDIVVSSNFERLLFDYYGRDGQVLSQLMDQMNAGEAALSTPVMTQIAELFSSHAVSDQATCDTMHDVFTHTGELLDPHTAIGVAAGRAVRRQPEVPMVVLGTAHPVKFSEAVLRAQLDTPQLPAHLADLMTLPERFTVMADDIQQVQSMMAERVFE